MTGFLGGGLVWVVRVMWLVRPPGRWLFVLDRGSVVVAIACGAVGGWGRGGPVMGGLFCGERRGRKFVPVHGVVRGEEESQSCNMTKALYIELWQYSISAPFLTTLCQGHHIHTPTDLKLANRAVSNIQCPFLTPSTTSCRTARSTRPWMPRHSEELKT